MEDDVTLLTRPRRFGKTLNMDMLNCFFSNRYEGRGDLFEGLSIWNDETYRQLQGTYPVIFLSFADIKALKYEDAREGIVMNLQALFDSFKVLWENDTPQEKKKYDFMELDIHSSDMQVGKSLQQLSGYLHQRYGKKVIILLDEYDTPLQEAYVNGYWVGMAALIRTLFNAAFKTNPHLERALMTGITRVSKESIFSDLNNLNVVTTTSDMYTTAFGFTQDEVSVALEEYGLAEKKEEVKYWYDGFTFGTVSDIYNPWSITNFIKKKEFAAYWANTSSNSLVGMLVKQGSQTVKHTMETLLAGESLETEIDEEIVFNQISNTQNAIWSLMLAAGYLKIENSAVDAQTGESSYKLRLTNLEVKLMFRKLISGWFAENGVCYSEFINAMKKGDLEEMNYYLGDILLRMASSFDGANEVSEETQPERFYHGLVLGLVATERDYHVTSNAESGLGRCDVLMIPKNSAPETLPAFVLEFKLFDKKREQTLEDTVTRALEQIREKAYDTAILSQGIPKERIRHYGFGFQGKTVLIETDA